MEDFWLSSIKRLNAIAATGLYYSQNLYDQERFTEIAAISQRMMAALGTVPLNRLAELVPDTARGYATPMIDVRGALFEDDRILLVQENTDGLWTLPGGFADIGFSAGENVVKEIWEEAGIRARASSLYRLRHKAKHDYNQDVRDFYKLFFLCDIIDATQMCSGPETSAVGFFSLHELPPLSTGRVLAKDITAAFACRTMRSGLYCFD